MLRIAAGMFVLLSECEGVEPELFFRAQSESVIRFAKFLENGGASR